jgi:ABC-2 type transport system permease protein/sodium transport system permease protein
MPPTSPVALVARLARKELREILRDRRTIVTLVLMPVLVYPLLTIAFRQYFLSAVPPDTTVAYRVAIATDAEEERLSELLGAVARKDDPGVVRTPADDVARAVQSGDADVGVKMANAAAPFDPRDPRRTFACELVVRDDSGVGLKAAEYLKERLTDVNLLILQRQLAARGVRQPSLPVPVTTTILPRVEGKKSSILSSLVPLILVLMTISGAVYPAIDLTAGERERGTLEVLMAAPIPRFGVLLAKYVAVLAVAMLTGLVNLTMMTVTVQFSGLGKEVFGAGLSAGLVAAMLGLLLLFAMFFSAVLLAVTSFARSFKEAQAYLIPLMLLALAPGMLSLMDIQLTGALKVAPLVNVVLLAREIFKGGVPLADVAIVVGSTLAYAAAAIGVASRVFGAEAVLYSEQGQVADLFRRPQQPQPAPTPAGALMCLAVLFPLTVLAGGALSQLDVRQDVHLGLNIVAATALFLGVPGVAAWFGRVDVRSGFRLRPAPLAAFAAAVVLGLSLWPLVAQLIVLEESYGVSSMPKALADKLHELAAERRSESPVLVLLTMAVVPAVVEELFFRGWLFTALEQKMRPRSVVLITAGLFGLFHLFTGGVLLIERLLPSALLGVALGGLRWRSGSVIPGILLHVLHNGLLVSMSLFPVTFGPLADAVDGTGSVPVVWLVTGALGALAGGALLWWSGRRRK